MTTRSADQHSTCVNSRFRDGRTFVNAHDESTVHVHVAVERTFDLWRRLFGSFHTRFTYRIRRDFDTTRWHVGSNGQEGNRRRAAEMTYRLNPNMRDLRTPSDSRKGPEAAAGTV